MATLADIRNWVRTQTLVDPAEVTNTEILTILNQGLRDVASFRRWPFLDATTTLITVADQAAYALPANLARVEAVYYSDRPPMFHTTRHSALVDHGTATATNPAEFYLFAETIVFAPAPSVAAQVINLDYQKVPTVMVADADTPPWAEAFHFIVAEYAAAKLWEREEDLEKTAYHMGAFYDGISRMTTFYDTRTVNTPVIVGGSIARVIYPWDWQTN